MDNSIAIPNIASELWRQIFSTSVSVRDYQRTIATGMCLSNSPLSTGDCTPAV